MSWAIRLYRVRYQRTLPVLPISGTIRRTLMKNSAVPCAHIGLQKLFSASLYPFESSIVTVGRLRRLKLQKLESRQTIELYQIN